MTPRHPVRAALGAALIALAVIAIFGNQRFFERVYLDARSDLARALLRIPTTFTWRFSRVGEGTTLWIAQLTGAVLVILGVFFAVWAVARRATGFALFIGAWGATILAAMVAGLVQVLISYGERFRGIRDPQGLGRFWFAVFNGAQPAALFGAAVGVPAAFLAVLLAGSAERNAAESAPQPAWQPAPAGAPPAYQPLASADPTAVYGFDVHRPVRIDDPVGADHIDPDATTVMPAAGWGAPSSSPPVPPPPGWEDQTSRG